jgi:hypothetical protein
MTMNRTTEHLINARDRIANRETWCQHVLYSSDGPGGPRKMCAYGALNYDQQDFEVIDKASIFLTKACRKLYNIPYPRWPVLYTNDKLGHQAILQAFNQAIADSMAEDLDVPLQQAA